MPDVAPRLRIRVNAYYTVFRLFQTYIRFRFKPWPVVTFVFHELILSCLGKLGSNLMYNNVDGKDKLLLSCASSSGDNETRMTLYSYTNTAVPGVSGISCPVVISSLTV